MHLKITRWIFHNSFLFALLVLTGAFVMKHRENNAPQTQATQQTGGFAVAELFTSEGCSSCPPADALLAALQQEYGTKELYVLAYHVDYWDRQGWKDRFSSRDYSERQQQYAAWLNLSTVYTPQLVINGQSEYVGSNRQDITAAITGYLQQSPARSLQLRASLNQGKIQVQYSAAAAKNTELVLALVQKNGDSNVQAGENAGRHLAHVQIVRALVKASLNQSTVSIPVPAGFTSAGWELIGMMQNTRTGFITDAAKCQFN